MTKRTLSLKRETIGELAAADLRDVVGAAASGLTCPVLDCAGISREHTCVDCLTRACG